MAVDEQALPGNTIPGSAWMMQSMPAVNTIVTLLKAAPGAGMRHVITHVIYTVTADVVAPAPTVLTVYVNIPSTVFTHRLSLQGIAGETRTLYLDSPIVAAVNGAVQVGFLTAGGANVFESVAVFGYTIDG